MSHRNSWTDCHVDKSGTQYRGMTHMPHIRYSANIKFYAAATNAVECRYNAFTFCHDIKFNTAMPMAERKS